MEIAATHSTSPDAPPDWNAISEDLACPLCDYNLRGLVEPRCPECGYRFAWREMLDPAVRLHLYLFEHHPERSLWSLRRTLVGSLRPKRFWKSIHPVQPSRPMRLVKYWGILVVGMLIVLSCESIHTCFRVRSNAVQIRSAQLQYISSNASYEDHVIRRYGSVQAFLDRHFTAEDWGHAVRTGVEYFGANLPALLGMVAIPWVTVLALLVFQFSMRRARIRTTHVVRAVIYSQGVMLAALLIATILGMSVFLMGPQAIGRYLLPLQITTGVIAAYGLIAGAYGVIVAYRDYLRFDHPVWTVLAAYAIAALILVNLGYLYNNWL